MRIALVLLLAAFSSYAEKTNRPEPPITLPRPVAAPPRVLTPSWEVPVPGTAVPMVTGMETSFAVATREGRITGHRLDSGERLWENDLATPLFSPPLFIEGQLVVVIAATPSPVLVFLDPLTGLASRRVPVPDGEKLTLTGVTGGLALTGLFSGSPGVRLYSVSGGALLWESRLDAAASAPVSQCGQVILSGAADGMITALSATDGSRLWTEKLPGPITTSVVCNGSRAWVGSADNHIHSLRMGRRSCRRRWSYSTGGDIAGRINLFNQQVSFLSYDTYLYSLAADNGHLQWKVRLGRRPQTDSVIVGATLVLAQLNTERLEFFSLTDGGQTASLSLTAGGERFVTPPARAGSMVVIGAARYGEESSRIMGIAPLSEPPAPTGISAPR